MKTLTIYGQLTDFNKHEKAARGHWRTAAKIKKAETNRVAKECLLIENKHEELKYPIDLNFYWYCKDKKIDKDNLAFAKKYILDGMVAAGVIPNDTWEYIGDFSDIFLIDKLNPRIVIQIL